MPRRWAIFWGRVSAFGVATDVVAAGEGIETTLSVRSALQHPPVVAALSANHLAASRFGVTLQRL
jgi:hypothetical protein